MLLARNLVVVELTQAYGTFSGTVTLASGDSLPVDNLYGFAEDMSLAW